MDDLAHYRRPILQEVVERLGLNCKPARARPLGVLWLELAEEFVGLERRRDGMEVGCIGVDGGSSSIRS